MAERDLAVVAGEDVQPEQGDEVDRDERELREPELAHEPRQHGDHGRRCREQRDLERGGSVHQTRRTATWPNSPCGRIDQDEQQDGERRRQPQLAADEVDVRAEQVDDHAERQPADDGADRAVDPAEHRRREGVDQDDEHHGRVEEEPSARPSSRRSRRARRRGPSRARASSPRARRRAGSRRG